MLVLESIFFIELTGKAWHNKQSTAVGYVMYLLSKQNLLVDDPDDGCDSESSGSDFEIGSEGFLLSCASTTNSLLLRHLLPHLQRLATAHDGVQVHDLFVIS